MNPSKKPANENFNSYMDLTGGQWDFFHKDFGRGIKTYFSLNDDRFRVYWEFMDSPGYTDHDGIEWVTGLEIFNSRKCECGSAKVGSPGHAGWCPLYV